MFGRRFWRYWKYPLWAVPPVRCLTYRPITITIPKFVDTKIQSWRLGSVSCELKSSDMESDDYDNDDWERDDFAVGQVWGFDSQTAYLLEQIFVRTDVRHLAAAVRLLRKCDASESQILMENTRDGSKLIQALRQEIPTITVVDPAHDPLARAHSVNELLKAGRVYLPHPSAYGWVAGFIHECALFPEIDRPNQVSAMTQALAGFNLTTG